MCAPLARRVETRWAQRFGAAETAELRAAGLRPYDDGWRAHPPYAHLTEAMLADPLAVLPHYPMVSHRRGFPDGS